ncbi:MAG TPA: RNB domain-containing ribonuclease, partial [Myxococcota bacterium]|nr:RNB domain-containing ribonuclease [Myxococcota bacterium]
RQGAPREHLSPDELAAFTTYRDALIAVAAHGRESDRFAFVQPLCEAVGVHPDLSFDLLVSVGELAPDDNLAAQRAGLPLTFSAEVLAEADDRATHRPQPSLDLSSLYAVAIDDPETTEVDDAVALSGDRIHVLIADAASYVLPGSAIDKAAMERTSTIYLPEGKVPMVPEVLGEGPMSLNPGEAKTALVFSFELAADGGLTAFDIQRARVRIARRYTYTEVDELLRAPTPHTNEADALVSRLEALMNRHRDYRHKKGAVTFQRPEVYYGVDPLGPDDKPGQRKVRIKIGDPLGPARQLIAELMVATCSGAAVYCAERQIPCVYRTQAAPDDPTQKGHAANRAINPSSGLVDDAALQYELLRRMKPSVLTTTPGPHWTL